MSSRFPNEIDYSERYQDDKHIYRHVTLTKDAYKAMRQLTGDKRRLLTESEWRGIGVVQSAGWEHYELFGKEPHILLYRRANIGLLPTCRATRHQLYGHGTYAYAYRLRMLLMSHCKMSLRTQLMSLCKMFCCSVRT